MNGYWGSTVNEAATGEVVTVHVNDPANANTTITVSITNDTGGSAGTIEIALDAQGKGSNTFTMPAGAFVSLSHGDESHQINKK